MDSIFYFIDLVVSIIGPVSDFFWEFPTNFEWYSSIPVLGEFSFSTFTSHLDYVLFKLLGLRKA